jgi:DNA-binding transcriptional LysR family regulator
MLDLVKLTTLRAVVERGSFSAAGEALGLTQPAVSRQISLLERQAGTQLVRRTRQGALPTEAGSLLVEHADAIAGRLAIAEAEVADLAGLRSGHVRMGSFFTAMARLSTEVAVVLEERHPELFRQPEQPITDELVDRRTAFRRLATGELDVAIVHEHEFEPDLAPDGVELHPMFEDPARVLLPAGHELARAERVRLRDLRGETWLRPHTGIAARLLDHVLRRARLDPEIRLAGHGDEPVEAQAFVAAGRGVALAHELNILIDHEQIASVPIADRVPSRWIQAAIMREQRAPAARAVVDAMREVGERQASRLAGG